MFLGLTAGTSKGMFDWILLQDELSMKMAPFLAASGVRALLNELSLENNSMLNLLKASV
jgi:hypothetical protein